MSPVLETSVLPDPEPQSDYAQLIADNVPNLLKGGPPLGTIEVSPLHQALPIQPGDWMACVRSSAEGQTAFFSVFIKAHKITTARHAVLIDRCEDDQYGPLPKPTPPKLDAKKLAK